MAYVNRFIQGKKRHREEVISAKELRVSFLKLVQITQRFEFISEYKKLEKSESLAQAAN